jgi:hypothetical protein
MGARTLPLSTEGLRIEPDVVPVPVDSAEMEEMLDVTDSWESSRVSDCAGGEGRRGGRAGDGRDVVDAVRGGARRGGGGFPLFALSCPVRTIPSGGGRTVLLLFPAGSFPIC